jgi:hypothetical protein
MHTVNFTVIDHLLRLRESGTAHPQVKAIARQQLSELKSWLEDQDKAAISKAYRDAYIAQIDAGKILTHEQMPVIPPGSPIGMECIYQ